MYTSSDESLSDESDTSNSTDGHDWRLNAIRKYFFRVLQNDTASLRVLRNISQHFGRPDKDTGENIILEILVFTLMVLTISSSMMVPKNFGETN